MPSFIASWDPPKAQNVLLGSNMSHHRAAPVAQNALHLIIQPLQGGQQGGHSSLGSLLLGCLALVLPVLSLPAVLRAVSLPVPPGGTPGCGGGAPGLRLPHLRWLQPPMGQGQLQPGRSQPILSKEAELV